MDYTDLTDILTDEEKADFLGVKKKEMSANVDGVLIGLDELAEIQGDQLAYYHKHVLPLLIKLERTEQAMTIKRVARSMSISAKNIRDDLRDEYDSLNIYSANEPYEIGDNTENMTDVGNAIRFARLFKNKVLYCAEIGNWLIWDGKRWATDKIGAIMEYAQKAIRSLYRDIANMDGFDERKEWLEHATKSEAYPRMKAMITLAQSKLPVTVEQLDANPWLLNVENGVINLQTGNLLPHDHALFITKIVAVKYDPDAKCPVFDGFLADIFPLGDGAGPNVDLIRFVQRFLGYCLTGDTSEQKLAIAWGSGANGKGTLLNLFSDMMGDYAQTAQAESFMAKKSDNGVSNDIAMLRGARYVLASESQDGRRLNEALIKQVTGQDKLTARFLYKDFFTFLPAFKLLLLTNYKPTAHGDDAALWRRILLVPFTQKFEGAKVDMRLNEKLRAPEEMEGVLRWAVEGCLMWKKEGLSPSREVIQATNEYRNENDLLENWKEERCVTGNYITEKIGTLYNDFIRWADENGEKTSVSNKKFSQSLTQKGFELFKGGGGVRRVKGIGLLVEGAENVDFASLGEEISVE